MIQFRQATLFTPKLFAVVKAKCSTSWRKEEKLRKLYGKKGVPERKEEGNQVSCFQEGSGYRKWKLDEEF
jgi:hypothetical protein